MTLANERDECASFIGEERALLERVKRVSSLRLDELQVGDSLGIVARDGRVKWRNPEGFILEVISIEQIEQDGNGRPKVTFRYTPGFFGFAFYDEQGGTLTLEFGATLESGFSSISTHTIPNHQLLDPDYNRIKVQESYWFRNAGGTGQVAIARGIRDINLLR